MALAAATTRSMSLQEKLINDMKEAMKAKDALKLACIRQMRAKLQEASNAQPAGFEPDDAFVQNVITAYGKVIQKGIDELASVGTQGAELKAKYEAELLLIKAYLPELLSPEKTREIVIQAVATAGATAAKDLGKVMGEVMKTHKGLVDAGLVRQIAQELLG